MEEDRGCGRRMLQVCLCFNLLMGARSQALRPKCTTTWKRFIPIKDFVYICQKTLMVPLNENKYSIMTSL